MFPLLVLKKRLLQMLLVGGAFSLALPTLAQTMVAPVQGGLPIAAQQGSPAAMPSVVEPDRALGRVATPPSKLEKREIPPSQFQLFVKESTGRLLPTFGSEIFANASANSADGSLPVPKDYALGVGDEVRLRVWGSVDFGLNLILDRNGQVSIPKVGTLTLVGTKVLDLEPVLRGHLNKVFTNYELSASVGRLNGIQVYVVGHVVLPGTYQLSSLSTLVGAMFASGGPTNNGSMRAIALKRAGKTIATLDLYDFIAKGDKSSDMALMSGDVIVIPPVGPRAAVTGAFDQAAIYELKASGDSVANILQISGGLPALAKPQKALLERISVQSVPPRQVVEIALDAKGLQQALKDGDVLTLLPISPSFANAVTLHGVVTEPLRHSWFDGMKISDLIPEREALIPKRYYLRKNQLVMRKGKDIEDKDVKEGALESIEATSNVESRLRNMADQINWDYAVIERLDRETLTTRLIPFNLGKAVLQRDPAHNLVLQSGDVVTIVSQNDLKFSQERLVRLVRLEGEVLAPGVYEALPGETLPQLIQRVGGTTSQAYLFGTDFSRESVRQHQQENLDKLVRRLESEVQSQTTSIAANKTADSALIAQQQARAQIERLKSMKSSGRMSLELEPLTKNYADLPAIPLEDGDSIRIPSTPGYVSAYGSVNNENALIYKPGRTVADVIKSAGLTEDAEPDQAFILRADGSILAKRDVGGWFGSGFESTLLMPGDAIVVPAQVDRETRYNAIIRGFKDWTQILSNLGLGVAALKTLNN